MYSESKIHDVNADANARCLEYARSDLFALHLGCRTILTVRKSYLRRWNPPLLVTKVDCRMEKHMYSKCNCSLERIIYKFSLDILLDYAAAAKVIS